MDNSSTSESVYEVPSASDSWKPSLAALSLILLWVGYCYWETLAAMAQIWWRSETYAHGLIVPPISIWLIWRDRHRLATFRPQPTYWFIPLLAGVVFCWLLGELTAVNALTQFSVIGICVLVVMSLVGLPISKELAFPLIFLFFSVPIGDFLLPQLMEWTADFTVLALRTSGIPVYREGQNFVIPSGQWSVIEACSGIRYLIASLTVGTLYAYLTYKSLKRRLIFIVVSLLVPILANWLRAYMIVMLGHLSDNRLAAGIDHLIYGWIFFGVVIAIMFAIGMRWSEPGDTDQPPALPPQTEIPKTSTLWRVFPLLAFLVSAGPFADNSLRRANAATPVVLTAPAIASTWHAAPPQIDWQPVFNNPSAEFHSAYSKGDRWVGLYIAYYRNQNYERKLVTSTNVLATSLDLEWQILNSGRMIAPIAGKQQRIRQAELRKKYGNLDDRYIVWQWYWINGRLTSSDIEAKWLTALSMLSGRGDDSAAVVAYTPKLNAEATLSEFANDQGSAVLHALTETQRK